MVWTQNVIEALTNRSNHRLEMEYCFQSILLQNQVISPLNLCEFTFSKLNTVTYPYSDLCNPVSCRCGVWTGHRSFSNSFEISTPHSTKPLQQYLQYFISPLCCYRHTMHVHYLRRSEGDYRQPCPYSSCVNQILSYSLDFHSFAVVESISLTAHCPHMLFWYFSIQGKHVKCIFCIGITDSFSSGQWKSSQKLSIWFQITYWGCDVHCSAKRHSAWQTMCAIVHTWEPRRELLFWCNIPYNLENIEPLKSVPVMRSSSLRSWLSRVSNRLPISYCQG